MQTSWWPLSDHWSVHFTSPHLPGFVWYGGMKTHGSYLRYADIWWMSLTKIQVTRRKSFFGARYVPAFNRLVYCRRLDASNVDNHGKPRIYAIIWTSVWIGYPGPTFIKPDQRNPWIKDQLWNDLLSTILHLQLPNFVSCGRDKPSHMTQNLVTVGVKL